MGNTLFTAAKTADSATVLLDDIVEVFDLPHRDQNFLVVDDLVNGRPCAPPLSLQPSTFAGHPLMERAADPTVRAGSRLTSTDFNGKPRQSTHLS
jgi:hypothetical protein